MARRRSKRPSVETQSVRWLDAPDVRLVRWHVDLTRSKIEKVGIAKRTGGDLDGALVRVVVKYREGDQQRAQGVAADLGRIAREGGAKHIYSPQWEPVRERVERVSGLDEHTTPLDAVRLWLKERKGLDKKQQKCILNEVSTYMAGVEGFSFAQPKPFSIQCVRVANYKPFKGEQVFGPGLPHGAFAVCAKYMNEHARSNRAGKSAFLGAVRSALFGSLRSTDIHAGENKLSVEVSVAVDGDSSFSIRREVGVKAGYSSIVSFGSGESKLVRIKKQEAADRVYKVLGMGLSDFDRVCFVREGDLHGLLGETDAGAKDVLAKWFGLDGWSRVNSELVAQYKERENAIEHIECVLGGAREIVEEGKPGPKEMERLREEVDAASEKVAQLKDRKKVVRELEKLHQDALQAEKAKEKLDSDWPSKARKELKRLESEYKRLNQERGKAKAKVAAANDLVREKKREIGNFSGKCPLDSGKCPRVDEINGNSEKQKVLVAQAEKKLQKAKTHLEEILEQCVESEYSLEDIRRSVREIERLEFYVEEYEKDGRASKQLAEELEGLARCNCSDQGFCEGFGGDLDEAMDRRSKANRELADALSKINEYNRATEQVEKHEKELDSLHDDVRILRLAVMATGRAGAPAIQIESAAGKIESMANEVLEQIGTDHRLVLSFVEELKKDEDACSACGELFEGAQRKCKACGEARGKAKREKFNVKVIDGSGHHSFDDDSQGGKALLALAFRVAVARYLGVSVLFLDEVCGSLDSVNLERFARLVSALPRMGFHQVFVISHRQEVADMLGKKIEIVRHPEEGRSEIRWEG